MMFGESPLDDVEDVGWLKIDGTEVGIYTRRREGQRSDNKWVKVRLRQ